MKSLPAALQASLDTGVTTLCRCWKLTRTDGEVLGFTDHDETVTFGGVDYEADSGMTASAWNATTGLSVDTMDAHGALSSGRLTESDLARGLWNGAAVEVYVVDWLATDSRVLMQKGATGEISRGALEFTCELRSISHALNQARGRQYHVLCDADLGDSRCGVDLDTSEFTTTGAVVGVNSRRAFTVSGLGSFDTGWFTRGLLTWTSGDNAGIACEVKRHLTVGGVPYLELTELMPFDIATGSPADAFTVTTGCDKSTGLCQSKFANILNHRGFPYMTGNDYVMRVPAKADGNTGGAIGGGGSTPTPDVVSN